MSFLNAVNREIANRPPNDSIRITLEYLLKYGIGRQNAVPLGNIVSFLNSQGISISETGFQQTILAESRDNDYFIGSCSRGYFLIDTIDDAITMRDFYQSRIDAEQQNLDNLRRQAIIFNWKI